jgi:hypothetical protein
MWHGRWVSRVKKIEITRSSETFLPIGQHVVLAQKTVILISPLEPQTPNGVVFTNAFDELPYFRKSEQA